MNNELYHHGILGMKWGIRRYQPYGQGGYNPKHKGKEIGDAAKAENKAEIRRRKAQSKADKRAAKKEIARRTAQSREDKRNARKAEANAKKEEKRLKRFNAKKKEILKDPKKILENRDLLTREEIEDALKEFDLKNKLIDAKVNKLSEGKKYVDMILGYADTAKKAYNIYATYMKDRKDVAAAKEDMQKIKARAPYVSDIEKLSQLQSIAKAKEEITKSEENVYKTNYRLAQIRSGKAISSNEESGPKKIESKDPKTEQHEKIRQEAEDANYKEVDNSLPKQIPSKMSGSGVGSKDVTSKKQKKKKLKHSAVYFVPNKDELYHYGVLGMKWGVRRYQPYGHGGYNPKNEPSQRIMSKMSKISDKISKDAHKISKKEFDDEVERNPKKYKDDFKKESLYKSIFNKKRLFDGNFDKDLRNEYEAEKKKLLDIDEQEAIQNKKQYEKLSKQSLNICGRDFDLDVNLDLYSGEPITKWHIEKMKQVKNLDFNSLKRPLKEYIKNDYIHADLEGKEISDNPFKYIKPNHIFINESPIQEKTGILMDCNYKFDPEHGLCFLFGEDGKVLMAAPIDYFI